MSIQRIQAAARCEGRYIVPEWRHRADDGQPRRLSGYDQAAAIRAERADPNIKADSGGTALAWALKAEYREIADLLRQAGAKE